MYSVAVLACGTPVKPKWQTFAFLVELPVCFTSQAKRTCACRTAYAAPVDKATIIKHLSKLILKLYISIQLETELFEYSAQ